MADLAKCEVAMTTRIVLRCAECQFPIECTTNGQVDGAISIDVTPCRNCAGLAAEAKHEAANAA